MPDYRDRRDSPAMTDRNRHEDLLHLTVDTLKVEKMHILHPLGMVREQGKFMMGDSSSNCVNNVATS